jgi:hypothetical protein
MRGALKGKAGVELLPLLAEQPWLAVRQWQPAR